MRTSFKESFAKPFFSRHIFLGLAGLSAVLLTAGPARANLALTLSRKRRFPRG